MKCQNHAQRIRRTLIFGTLCSILSLEPRVDHRIQLNLAIDHRERLGRCEPGSTKPSSRHSYQRVFAVDVMTPRCRGAMTLIELANEREAIERDRVDRLGRR